MKVLGLILILVAFLAMPIYAVDITFTFANTVFTDGSPAYYDFDIMIQASQPGVKLGDAQAYVNYNIDAFGTSISSNGKIEVTKGTMLDGGSPPFEYYSLVNIADNTSSRFAVTTEFGYPDYPEYSNEVPTTPAQYVHVRLEVVDKFQAANLSFQASLMQGQIYYYDNKTKFSNVIATDVVEDPIPVQLSAFSAYFDQLDRVLLQWETQSAIGIAGFNVLKGRNVDGDFHKINESLITCDNDLQTSTATYSYMDENASMEEPYYRLQVLELDGTTSETETVKATTSTSVAKQHMPQKFDLDQNYPNPFNPTTTINFQLPQASALQVQIFNLHGQYIKSLINGQYPAGYHSVVWDATNDAGFPVASGIYIVQMKTENYTENLKISLMR